MAGVALIALGIACLPPKGKGPRRNAVLGLLIFNVGAMFFFVWVPFASTFHGIMLWPGVILHAVIATAMLSLFLTTREPSL